ncbi:MAG: hypothetical protein CMJ42_08025 [Phyllobacteriaceae bacterium]|nr:hypothetical protein [Phyllobacteriaceae bacterium]MBA89715.1 hypothetical protein [Phyllobacteriaceae bacterium]MCB1461547.1 hypothetical protein [Nitratireductor sp.]|tara:strand:+ start:254 stop:535 length:282 start_codon:yes stop_codon:yes gene_type:complete
MINRLKALIEKRRTIRRRWQADARALVEEDELKAYYAAQRLAARSRFRGNKPESWHWAKVASEVARISPIAAMDLDVVQAINEDEWSKAPHSQ